MKGRAEARCMVFENKREGAIIKNLIFSLEIFFFCPENTLI